jgi:small subunit ribosomal protein S4e
VDDTVKVDIATGKILDSVKFDLGNLAFVTRGHNAGRVGVIQHIERHPGSFDIITVKDAQGHSFATRRQNVFLIGKGNKPMVSLPKGKGIKLSIIEERNARKQH